MAKKKKSTHSFKLFKSSWLYTLFIGLILGVGSQQIPEVRAITQEITQPIEHHFREESALSDHPISSFHIHRQGYSLAFDASRRNPMWVYEHLTADSLKGNVDRSNSEFKEDENLAKHLRAQLNDYKGSGFDRGHMASAADHKSNSEVMDDTFYMSNMCPQCPKFNRGYWASLEKRVRDLTRDYKNVYVISGPLYLPNVEEDGKRFVKYQVIGLNNIAVPTHFFKVLILEDWQGRKETVAYVLPNEDIPPKTSLDKFKASIEKVERASGIIFNKGN